VTSAGATVQNTDDKIDPHLPSRLRAESRGILTWAVRGCLEWQQDGLGVPPEVRDATDAYRDEMDSFGDFLAEKCVIAGDAKVKVSELYHAYERWCYANGEEAISGRRFGDRVATRGFEKKRSTGGNVYWFGVALEQTNNTKPTREDEPY
jgi:putative DNA primase/helicase